MRIWTEDQQAAIQDRDKNLLVSAAAGSGKTAVLVERIIQLILRDKVDIDRMLIVTFTQAAAGEMRERISSRLLAAMENDSGVATDLGEHLRSQISSLHRASISTLHAFCMEVVRKNFHIIDIDPKFRVGEEAETAIIKTEVLEELFEREYEKKSSSFLELVEMFGGSKDDTPLQQLVLRIYEFIQSKPEPLPWLLARVNDFSMDIDEFNRSSWLQSIKNHVRIELAGVQTLLRSALDIAQRPGGPEAYQGALESDLILTARLQAALDEGVVPFYEQITQVKHQRLARVGRDTNPDLKDEAKDMRDQAKKVIKDIQTGLLFQHPEEFHRDLNELHPCLVYLAELVQAFDTAYRRQKIEKGIVDFNDLEHYALQILAHQEIAAEYRRQYAYIFVDEYQDSNLVQETILNRIKRPDNLFLVGDVKQSIYRFRLADPSLFMEKYAAYANQAHASQRRIDLSKNFRSRPPIIAAINNIFRHIMSAELGEIDYNEQVYLHPGLNIPGHSEDELAGSEMELLLIDKELDSVQTREEDSDSQPEAGDVEIEAQLVAARINELQGQVFYDSQQGCCRPVEYRDMVVLMRATRRQADVYQETLMAAGIPVYADGDQGYFQTTEINVFMNLLKLIDNKRQDIPLLSVMRSPLGKFSADDLITIRVSCKASTYYEAVEYYLDNYNDPLQARLQKLIDRLNTWKEHARFTPMDEFIWQLMLDTGYYHYVGAMPGGRQRQANLRILLDRARHYQSTSLKGLFHFIKFADKLQAGQGDLGVAKILGENENVVRIMSIHKSKGLEFPIVILAGLSRKFNLRDTTAPVLFHKDLGIGPRYVNPEIRIFRDTIARMALKNQIKMESLAEEMRILYVACTRARDKLILIGSVSDLSKQAGKWSKELSPFQLARGRCHLDWIGPVIMRHPDGAILCDPQSQVSENITETEPDHRWNIKVLKHADITGAAAQKEELFNKGKLIGEQLPEPATDLSPIINSRLDWEYPFPEAVNIPSKVAVSQVENIHGLDRAYQVPDLIPLTDQPRFMKTRATPGETPSLSGSAKGTLLHFVMQHIDMTRVASEEQIRRQLEELVDKELLLAEEMKAVDRQSILKFFASSLGQRVLQARRVFREVPFNLIYPAAAIFDGLEDGSEQLLLQGVIDLYFEEDQGLVLVDYKTDRITAHNRSRLIAHYKVQIALYKIALEKILDQKVTASYLYLFDSDEEVLLDL